jgi:DNA-binding response OmpR family regulator
MILVIDDDEDLTEVLLEVLKAEGRHARVCSTGAQALAVLAVERPSVVLLDWSLPDTDPEELAEAFRAAGVPVILASGSDRTGELGARIGAQAVLDKPYDVAELLRVVERLTVTRSAGRPPV